MLSAVGIDVSKGKSTVAVLQADGTIIKKNIWCCSLFIFPKWPFPGSSSTLRARPEWLWNVLAGITCLSFTPSTMLESLSVPSIHTWLRTSATTPYEKSNRILLIPGKLPAMLLTTGLLCGNIQLWILLAHNLKPLIHRWTSSPNRKSLPERI